MAKITTGELEEMIRKNLTDKGLNEIEINEEDIKNISNKIKKEVNKGIQPKEEEEEGEVVNVDISKPEDEEGDSLESSEAITY